jgi:hypothetical protein
MKWLLFRAKSELAPHEHTNGEWMMCEQNTMNNHGTNHCG